MVLQGNREGLRTRPSANLIPFSLPIFHELLRSACGEYNLCCGHSGAFCSWSAGLQVERTLANGLRGAKHWVGKNTR